MGGRMDSRFRPEEVEGAIDSFGKKSDPTGSVKVTLGGGLDREGIKGISLSI
jgi:hypothetical protein